DVDLVPFPDLLSTIVDNRGKTCPTVGHGIPLIATNCVRNDLLYPAYDKIRFVSEETYCSWFRGHPQPGDLIFVTKGTPGRVCVVPDPVGFCIAQDMVAVRVNPKKVYPKFLFAVLRSRDVQNQIEQMHVGTLIPHFKKGDFDKLLLPVPDRRMQELLGDCYFDFCAKIELNRRMCRTLEGIARAIFQSWFVDFDPVRAKAAGAKRFRGMPQAVFGTLPAAFADSPLGPIPEGWAVQGLDEIASFLNGLALQKYPPRDGRSLPVIKIAQLRAGHTTGADQASADLDPAYVVTDGDVLFSWSGSLECVLWAGGQGALNQHLFKVTSERFPKWFFYFWIHRHLPHFRHIAAGKATTMGHIQRHHLSEAKVAVPPGSVHEAADRLLAPLVAAIPQRMVQSRTLAAIRDALLPKLLSGELRIADAEKIVGRGV
ncbi:MAG: restriction endonuclease subunit S, partial [Planctomycetota bacterium]